MSIDPAERLALMQAFAQSYRDRHFRPEHYDLAQGYLLGHPVPERRFIADFLLPTADTRVNTLSAML